MWRLEGGTIYSAKCQRNEHFAAFRSGGLSPVTLRSSVAVDASRARPDETQRGKVKQARRKSGKGKGKTPAGMCGVSAVSPLRESHGKINEESITRAHFEVSVRGSARLTAPPGRRGSKQAARACTARSPLAMATATSLPAADLSHQRRTPTTYRPPPTPNLPLDSPSLHTLRRLQPVAGTLGFGFEVRG